MLRTAAFLCALLLAAGPALAQDDPPDCELEQSLPTGGPAFARYPAGPSWQGKPATPVLATPSARLFRTQLRTQSVGKPDFAGHYKIASWGCGAPCIDWGMVDLKTGHVVMGDRYGDVDHMYVMADVLVYRPDSRLFVIIGAPSEKPERRGYTYLLWTGRSFRQIAFYPYKAYCTVQSQAAP